MANPADIFISVAEQSADMHAASLVRWARDAGRPWRFHGLTGPRIRALGVDTVFNFASHAAMLTGVFRVLGRAWRALRAAEDSWRRRRPDLVVLVDSPALHLPLARRAKRLGLPVLYYIAPQTWASRERRVEQIRRDVDVLACILPFEEAYFRRLGVNAEYVGHPLVESIAHESPDAAAVERVRARASGGSVLGLLPGSRGHVIDAVLPRQLEVVQRLNAADPRRITPCISCADASKLPLIRSLLKRGGSAAEVVVGDVATVLAASDLLLVASGTATLHAAFALKPMIVMYHAADWLAAPYALAGRLVVKAPHLALVNVLAGARIVPEFMPFIADVGPVAAVARRLLDDAEWRALMSAQLASAVGGVRGGASQRVGELIDRLVSQ